MKRHLLFALLTGSLVGTALAQQAPSTPPNSHLASPPSDPLAVTPDEWRELRSAHNAAIQADPTLLANHEKLIEKMRALEEKIDAAMVKADPTLSPIIAKFEANRPRVATAPNAQRVGGSASGK